MEVAWQVRDGVYYVVVGVKVGTVGTEIGTEIGMGVETRGVGVELEMIPVGP